MVANDPHNRKQPFILGMIALISGIILALFVIGKIRADELIDPPHDPQYNNLVWITVSNEMYVGGDTVVELYEGPSDGFYASVWKENFISAISDFFEYVPKDQCFIIVAADGATHAHMTTIREALTEVGAAYWSDPSDGNFESNDFSGYEDKRAPAGMYNIRYMSRIVKYLPISPTPSPTPDPNMQEYHVLVPNLYGASYNYNYMFTVKASGLNGTFVQPQDDTWNSLKVTYPDISSNLEYNAAILKTGRYTGSWLGNFYGYCGLFYFQVSSYSEVKLYTYSGGIVSDPDVMKTVGNVSDGQIISGNTTNCSYYVQELDDGGYCIVFVFRYSQYDSPDLSNYKSNIWFQDYSFNSNESINYSNPFASNSKQYSESLKLRLDVENNAVPDPNVTPVPPTPTEAPHVIINWPSGTPSPTPPFSVPGDIGSGTGSSSTGSLSPGQVGSTLNTFKQYTENNGAFAFLYACTSVIPDEALYFLFILLFVLLLIAVIRLFVHYGG